jgi:hypothetical protein
MQAPRALLEAGGDHLDCVNLSRVRDSISCLIGGAPREDLKCLLISASVRTENLDGGNSVAAMTPLRANEIPVLAGSDGARNGCGFVVARLRQKPRNAAEQAAVFCRWPGQRPPVALAALRAREAHRGKRSGGRVGVCAAANGDARRLKAMVRIVCVFTIPPVGKIPARRYL